MQIQQLIKEEATLNALLKFWGSYGFRLTDKLDTNNSKNLNPYFIKSLIQKMAGISIESGPELKEASIEFANFINRDFLNQTFNYFKTSENQTPRVFLKVVNAEFNSKNEIKPNTFMSFWERKVIRYNEILENPMFFAGPGTGSLIGPDHGYLVVMVSEEFPVVETRNLCDHDEVLIFSNDLLDRNCVLNFIPKFVEPEYFIDQPTFFQKLFGQKKRS